MDSSGLPFSTSGSLQASNDAGSTTGKTTHSNPILPAVMTAAPNVFPQVFPVVNQHAQPVYLNATNYFQPALNQHVLPQTTFYNQTVRENGDTSVQTRYMYISVSNNAVNSQQNPGTQQNNMTFVERNQMIPPYQYQSNPPVVGGIRPLVPVTVMGEAIQANGTAASIGRTISVRWRNPGGNPVALPPLDAIHDRSTVRDFRQISTSSDASGLHSILQPTDLESSSPLPQIPTQRVYPSNDPRLGDCKVQIPSNPNLSRPQRDPRSSTIVPRILARFTGSHGCVPPEDPRSLASTAKPCVSQCATSQQASPAPAPSSEQSPTDERSSQHKVVENVEKVQTNLVLGTEPLNPKSDAHPQTSNPVKRTARTKVVPRISDRRPQVLEQERSLDPRFRQDEVAQTNPRTRFSEDLAPIPNDEYASERDALNDEETESSGSPPPEDPRQKHCSRVYDSRAFVTASHERDVSPTPDLAADPRLGNARSDRRTHSAHSESVYNYYSRPNASKDQSVERNLPKAAPGIRSPKGVRRTKRETASSSKLTETEEDSKTGNDGSFLKFVDPRGLNPNRDFEVAERIDQSKTMPDKSRQRRFINFVDSDDSGSPPPEERRVFKGQSQQPDRDCDGCSGIPEEELPPPSTGSVSSEDPRMRPMEAPQSTKKPRRKRRGADTIFLSENNIMPVLSRKRKRTVRFADASYGRERSRSGLMPEDSDSDSERHHDSHEAEPKKIRRRGRRLVSSESDEACERNQNVAQRVDSSVSKSVEQLTERQKPSQGPAGGDIGEQGDVDEQDQLSTPKSVISSEPLVVSPTPVGPRLEHSRSQSAAVSTPSTVMDARLQSDEEEELRGKHERENAQLVYEKVCEFQQAFELQSPLRVRDDQMTALVGILGDILEASRASHEVELPTIAAAEEPKKIADSADTGLHKEESVKRARTEEDDEEEERNTAEEVTERKKLERSKKDVTKVSEESCIPTITQLLEPFKYEKLWSPYFDDEASEAPVPVIVLQDIHLGPSTTKRLKMKANEIRKREQICELCPFVSLNTLSLEKHVESYHAKNS